MTAKNDSIYSAILDSTQQKFADIHRIPIVPTPAWTGTAGQTIRFTGIVVDIAENNVALT